MGEQFALLHVEREHSSSSWCSLCRALGFCPLPAGALRQVPWLPPVRLFPAQTSLPVPFASVSPGEDEASTKEDQSKLM